MKPISESIAEQIEDIAEEYVRSLPPSSHLQGRSMDSEIMIAFKAGYARGVEEYCRQLLLVTPLIIPAKPAAK